MSLMPARRPNPKRKLRPVPEPGAPQQALRSWAERARYVGNPSHKRNAGDFGLTPPTAPRKGKTLCDDAGIFSREDAQQLLREGFQRGLVSVQERDGWPQNVWAVAPNGVELDAMLDVHDASQGTYHGYPLQGADPLRGEIQLRWNR